MFMRGLCLALLFVGDAASAATAAEMPVKDYWRHSEFEQIQISPDGKYLAATVPDEETRALVIFTRKDRKVTGVARFTDDRQVGAFAWVNKDRVAFTMSDRGGRLVSPQPRGELLFMRADGKDKAAYAGGNRGSLLTRTLRDGSDWVVVTDYLPSQKREQADVVLYRVNAKSAKSMKIAFSPVGNARFTLTHDGEPRVASGGVAYRQSEVHYYDAESKSWHKIHSEKDTGLTMEPWVMHGDGKRFYAVMPEKTGPSSLYLVDPNGKRELVVRDEVSDPTRPVMSLDGKEVIGVEFSSTMPRRHWLLPDHPDAMLLKNLQRSFDGQWVSYNNASDNGKLVVFTVRSDRNPGDFYLYDRNDRKATYLASVRQWMDPELMSEMKPIQYAARDGRIIHGWLTVPKGSDGKNLPLIVNPHGGPFGPYDDWGFSAEIQLFASRGYAVLQPNFRGSGGFGLEFTEAGYRQWGGTMQDDLTDATHWAVKEGIADAGRICIYGASYGAYAALMGVAKEPDLYQCAIGFVGVYDLKVLYSRGDIRERDSGVDFLEEVLGRSDAELIKGSPSKQASKIKVPVVVVAGAEDRRAPPAQSEIMVDEMKRAGKEKLVEAFYLQPGEGHGFYKVEHNVKLYDTFLSFFDRHIGKKAKPEAAAGL
ncbi:MAG: S9 family peptidase [Rhodanobacteraceae bacterium]|nr:S9 family peptidase [Rhodanobacteraceae bacterium]